MRARPAHLVILALVVATVAGAPLARPVAAGPRASPAQPQVPVFAAPAGYIVHGVHLDPVSPEKGGLWYSAEIDNFETAVGKDVGLVMYFLAWANRTSPCDNNYLPGEVDSGVGHPAPTPGPVGGRAVMITWEPLPILSNPGPADYDNILSGQYDDLITKCAQQLKAWSNKTFLLRFMHEMNIPDAAWWAGHSYNQKPDGTGDTEKFKLAWRHVWQIFRDQGVPNVQWVWSPNYGSSPNVAWNNLHNYYPGDQYVDWIGLSGYNWMAEGPGFQSFSDLYAGVLADLQCRYARPIILAEIGSAPYGGTQYNPPNKEGWIADALGRLQTYPLVRAVSWFNDFAYHSTAHADFRIWTNTKVGVGYESLPGDVPPSVTAAYHQAIASPAFTPVFDSARRLEPPMTRCPGDLTSANGVLSARPAAGVVGQMGQTTTHFAVGALGLAADTTLSISGCPANTTCGLAGSGRLLAPWDADQLVVTATGRTLLGSHPLTISGGGMSVQVTLTVLETVRQHRLPLVRR